MSSEDLEQNIIIVSVLINEFIPLYNNNTFNTPNVKLQYQNIKQYAWAESNGA